MSEQTQTPNYEQSRTPSLLHDGDEAYLHKSDLLPYDEGAAIARAAAKLAVESRPQSKGEHLSPQEQRVRQNGRAVIEMRNFTLAA